MSGAIVQSAYAVDDSGTTAATIAATLSGVTAGNLIVAHVGWGDSSLTCSTSDGTAYTNADGPRPDGTHNENGQLFFRPNVNSGSHTVTATISGGGAAFRRIRIAEVSGVATASPLDQAAGQVQLAPGTGTDAISSSATAATTNANDFVVGVTQCTSALDPGTGTLNAGTGYTATGTNIIMGLESKNVAATGAQTATFTQSVANIRISHVVAYKQAAGGVTVALTGQAASFAAGALAPDSALALTGKNAAFAAGTVVAGMSVALLGGSAALTSGLLTPNTSIALTGQSATFLTGTITASTGAVTVSLSGQAAAFTAGNLAPANSVGISGQRSTFSGGNVMPSSAAALSGQGASFTAGALSPGLSASLNGASAIFTPGNLFVPGDVTVGLTGARAFFMAGILVPSVPGSIQIPNVVGLNWYQASHVLITMSLNQTVIPVQVASNLPDGEVLSQMPPAGTNVDPHTNVVLTVSISYLLSASFDVISVFV